MRETRLGAHHKLALRLIRDNQAVNVEDLAVSGLARTRLAKSVHDAGWATLVRLLEEKAERCHRQVVRIGHWLAFPWTAYLDIWARDHSTSRSSPLTSSRP